MYYCRIKFKGVKVELVHNVSFKLIFDPTLQVGLRQGSKGIRQWPINIPIDDTQNYSFCRLQLVVYKFGIQFNKNNQSSQSSD